MSFLRPKASYSGTPLNALSVVALDTETTGLHIKNDRIVEIGAIRIQDGSLKADDQFMQLVNPGIPIPKQSTHIHTITDTDIADAPDFPQAFDRFAKWAGRDLLIGFSLAFDLGILKAEHQRHQQKWRIPRWLDVANLVQLLAPNLPNLSLDVVANWLNVPTTNRHRALGDATMTAACFLALLPKLRAQGIVSLAQAERACTTLAHKQHFTLFDTPLQEEHWLEHNQEHTLALIDSFAYRHKVADVMKHKPLTCQPHTSVRKALAMLMQHQVSSVFFLTGKHKTTAQKEVGICTERDILRALNKHQHAALDLPVKQVGNEPLITIHKEEYLYRAMSLMVQHNLRHLGITDNEGKVCGAITSRDLLHQRSGDAANLGQQIAQAHNADALGKIWTALNTVIQSLVYEDVDVRDCATLISSELRNLTRRACEIAETKMHEMHKGAPPCPYAVLILGSGGRGESLLAMDQDNAIVYQPKPNQDISTLDTWFANLGSCIADTLNDAGVPYCKGGVMASNKAWRKPYAQWRSTVDAWIERGTKEDIMHCDIFFDAVPVHGDSALANQLLDYARTKAHNTRSFLALLALQCSLFEPATSLFGSFRLKDGRIDCKLNGILPIISTARLQALRFGIVEGSTPRRLEQAAQFERHHTQIYTNLIQAHQLLLDAIIKQQLRDLDNGISLSNTVVVDKLTNYEKEELRWALKQVKETRSLLDLPIG